MSQLNPCLNNKDKRFILTSFFLLLCGARSSTHAWRHLPAHFFIQIKREGEAPQYHSFSQCRSTSDMVPGFKHRYTESLTLYPVNVFISLLKVLYYYYYVLFYFYQTTALLNFSLWKCWGLNQGPVVHKHYAITPALKVFFVCLF